MSQYSKSLDWVSKHYFLTFEAYSTSTAQSITTDIAMIIGYAMAARSVKAFDVYLNYYRKCSGLKLDSDVLEALIVSICHVKSRKLEAAINGRFLPTKTLNSEVVVQMLFSHITESDLIPSAFLFATVIYYHAILRNDIQTSKNYYETSKEHYYSNSIIEEISNYCFSDFEIRGRTANRRAKNILNPTRFWDCLVKRRPDCEID